MRNSTAIRGAMLLSWGHSVPWMATPPALRFAEDFCLSLIRAEEKDFPYDPSEYTSLMKISRSELVALEEIDFKPQHVQADSGYSPDWSKDKTVQILGRTAIIPVQGIIYRYADFFSMMCGGTTTQQIATDLRNAQKDPSIDSIVLEIDSPGGEADGIAELARQIRATTQIKPVIAHGDGDVASAAYYLAAAAGKLVVSPSAMVGCIGTICSIPNPALDMGPKRSLPIVSKQSPKKNIDTSTQEGINQIQTWVDDLSQVFINDVAEFRGTTPKKVEENYGQGDVMIASKALKVGMVDAIGGLDDVLAELAVTRNLETPQPAKETGGKRMGLLARIQAAMGGTEDPELERDLEAAVAAPKIFAAGFPIHNPPPVPVVLAEAQPVNIQSVGIPDEVPDSPELIQLREQIAQYQQREIAAKAESLKVRASGWAKDMVLSGKATPAEQELLTQVYISAAEDDEARGPITLASGPIPVTRVGMITGLYDLRAAQDPTGERIPAGGSGEAPQLRILPNNVETPQEDPDAEMAVEEHIRLLNSSATGKMRLKEMGLTAQQ